MKKLLFLFCGLLLLAGFRSRAENVSPIELNGTSSVRIVIPAEHANPGIETFLRQCAGVIRRGLKETLNIDAPVEIEGKERPFEGHTIFLGRTEAIRKIGLDPAGFEERGAVVASREGNIFIAGLDCQRYGKPGPVRGSGECVLGTVTGTIRFVERFLNGRFLFPGPNGLDFVKSASVVIPDNLTCHITPRIVVGGGRSNELFYDYSSALPGPGKFFLHGGHSYYDAVPEKKYAESHPEYFAFRGGKRSAHGNHLCISNPEVQDLIYKEMLRHLDDGAEVVELAQTDGFIPCLCDKCKAFGGTGDDYGEKLWILHRSLAERLLKDRPGKKVLIICYPPNFEPPKSFSAFPANAMIELCKYSDEVFDAWKKIEVPGGFVTYIYNWGIYQTPGYTAKRTPAFAAKQAKTFAANGVKGVYRCGFGELFGMEGPVYYVYGKMLEDPELDYETLLRDYYGRAYHESAAPMRAFFDALHKALDLGEKGGAGFGNPVNFFGAVYPPDVMEKLEKNLLRAEKLAVQPKVKARLKLVRKEFDYLKSIVDVVRMYQAYRTAPSWTTFDLLAQKIDARNALVDSMLNEKGRVRRLKEFPFVRFFDDAPRAMLKRNGRLSAPLGAPFNWNMKFLKEKEILPGMSMKRMTVTKLSGAPEFNDFESGVWKDLKWEQLGGIQLGPIGEKTRFKVAWDDENFYMAFVSDLDPKKTFRPLGKDAPCWRDDCLEILLDPKGDRQSYYHMIYTPAADSTYDDAFGFITDPLHPLYNKADPSWDGKWSYQCRRENGKWYSLFTAPFATLKTPPPKPGTSWTLNVGRESRPAGSSGHGDPELSTWSPNLENARFGDCGAFGEAVFQ